MDFSEKESLRPWTNEGADETGASSEFEDITEDEVEQETVDMKSNLSDSNLKLPSLNVKPNGKAAKKKRRKRHLKLPPIQEKKAPKIATKPPQFEKLQPIGNDDKPSLEKEIPPPPPSVSTSSIKDAEDESPSPKPSDISTAPRMSIHDRDLLTESLINRLRNVESKRKFDPEEKADMHMPVPDVDDEHNWIDVSVEEIGAKKAGAVPPLFKEEQGLPHSSLDKKTKLPSIGKSMQPKTAKGTPSSVSGQGSKNELEPTNRQNLPQGTEHGSEGEQSLSGKERTADKMTPVERKGTRVGNLKPLNEKPLNQNGKPDAKPGNQIDDPYEDMVSDMIKEMRTKRRGTISMASNQARAVGKRLQKREYKQKAKKGKGRKAEAQTTNERSKQGNQEEENEPAVDPDRLSSLITELRQFEPFPSVKKVQLADPRTVCFHFPGTDLTHHEVLAAVKRAIAEGKVDGHVTWMQFVNRSTIQQSFICSNRWVIQLSSSKARNHLIFNGMTIRGHKMEMVSMNEVIADELRKAHRKSRRDAFNLAMKGGNKDGSNQRTVQDYLQMLDSIDFKEVTGALSQKTQVKRKQSVARRNTKKANSLLHGILDIR